jgi:hypothetical protein
MWMRLIVRVARLLPAFRRLQDRLDQFASDNGRLERLVAQQREALAKLRQQRGTDPDIRHLLEQQAKDRADGRLVEFEYPYRPHVRDWDTLPRGNVYRQFLAQGEASYRTILEGFLSFADQFSGISVTGSPDDTSPYWDNGWLPVLDGISIYGMLATKNPRYYFEVGSGNSTKFARKAIQDHNLRTRIISVDPQPRANIDTICDEVIRCGLENVDLARFVELGREDILFIDNSHRSFQGSDVTVFFTEVLPTLGEGCIYGIHDILLPGDYPRDWLQRFYNEQYLLMAYLLGGAGGDEILLPVSYVYMNRQLASALDPITALPVQHGAPGNGSIFWMRRGPSLA